LTIELPLARTYTDVNTRTEQEMVHLVLDRAKQDNRIRTVIMNGSRADSDAKPDIFQDFDIVYQVTDVAPFVDDVTWVDRFGERTIIQMSETVADPPPRNEVSFVYLMQFADGNRIDLCLFRVEDLERLPKDSMSLLLLDKDGLAGPLAPASAADHLASPPTGRGLPIVATGSGGSPPTWPRGSGEARFSMSRSCSIASYGLSWTRYWPCISVRQPVSRSTWESVGSTSKSISNRSCGRCSSGRIGTPESRTPGRR